MTYTLTASNAAGSAPPATQKINVSPVSITQFLANPDSVTAGTASNLSWQIEGANDTTQSRSIRASARCRPRASGR